MGTHPIFESDFDCLTDKMTDIWQLDEKKQVDIAEKVSRVFKSGEIDRSDKNLSEALKLISMNSKEIEQLCPQAKKILRPLTASVISAKLSGNQFINLESESDTKVRILGTQKDLTIDLENSAALEALIFEFQSIDALFKKRFINS